MLADVLGMAIDSSMYECMWLKMTSLLLMSKHMAQAVCLWRAHVRTLNFLPVYDHLFITRVKDNEEKEFKARKVLLAHVRTTIARHFPNADTLVFTISHNFDVDELKSITSVLPHLKNLDLGFVRNLVRKELQAICSYLPRLQYLKLYSHDLDEECLFMLAKRTKDMQMVSLMLHTTLRTTNESFMRIVDANPTLREFQLSNTSVTDEGIDHLVNSCTQLEYIDLSHSTFITNASIQKITTTYPGLKTLKLNQCGTLTEQAFVHIGNCSLLHTLDIGSCCIIRDPAFTYIAQCTALRSFGLNDCWFLTSAAMQALSAKLTHLEEIHMYKCNMDDSAILALTSECHKLKYLKLSEAKNITSSAFEHIGDRCAKLKFLDLSECKNVRNEALEHVSNCLLLEVLVLEGCSNIGNKGVVAVVKKCKYLKYLDLNRCNKLTNHTIAAIALDNLECITLARCNKVTNASIEVLLKSCPNLKCDYFEQRTYDSDEKRDASIRTQSLWRQIHNVYHYPTIGTI